MVMFLFWVRVLECYYVTADLSGAHCDVTTVFSTTCIQVLDQKV